MSKMPKKPKDPNAPKKNQSSYFIYSNERRSILQSENKDKKITEISKLISAEWKLMSPTTKSEYDRRSKEAKKEYDLKFAEYKKTDNYTKYQAKLAQWTQDQKDKGFFKGGKTTKGGKNKGPKKPKQPEKMPKRPQSSYFVFSNKRRNELKDHYPDKKITELSKLISEEWKVMTADDKKIYEEAAKVNKERYTKSIAIYKETDEYSEYQKVLNQYKDEKKRWEKSGGMDADDAGFQISLPRKPKDKNCPKRGLTSYFLYAKEVREKTKEEHPTKQITELAKEISKKWKLVTDEDKKPYNEEAVRLKEAYKIKMEAYKGSDAAKEFELKLEKWKEECAKRKREAREKQMAKKEKMKKPSPKRKKTKKEKEKMQMDSDSDDSDSDSDSSSSSGS
eukprot:342516_1